MHHLRGEELTLEYLSMCGFREPLIVDRPDGLHMSMPPASFTVQDVLHHVGDRSVDVIDVHKQSSLSMRLSEWVDYFSQPTSGTGSGSGIGSASGSGSAKSASTYTSSSRSTAATSNTGAGPSEQQKRTRVLNIISLEFSQTSLSDMVVPPLFVQQISWVDLYWPGGSSSFERNALV